MRRMSLFFLTLLAYATTLAQLDTSDVEIVGFIRSNQLCVLTNSEKRTPYRQLHERYAVIDRTLVEEYGSFNDTIMFNLLREQKSFIDIHGCFNLLNEVFHKFEGNDTVLNWLQQSYPIKFIEDKDGSVFCVIEKNIDYVIHHSVVIDKRYSLQDYNTECFLLVSAPYHLCFNRQPLLSFGDGIYRDFWLDPESKQRVTVIIPLICRN
ncbi:MAG: hypothetical protein J6T87_02580 [Bacteroidales bacterium]|nr:hypothetical protein [Bacteroidales bacterium]